MSYQRDAKEILADWRAVERDLRDVSLGTLEAARLHAEVERLRAEYQQLIDDAADGVAPEVPPFPTESEPE